MSAAEVLRQAEELKEAVGDTTRSANEVWVSRQALQDSYQKLLVIDLEFALDKKVEQDLWNHAFKKQISTLQNQAKDKQNQKRGEVQSSLNLFLETASGFYLQLLQVICSAFNLDLPFRKKSSHFGIMREFGPVMAKIKTPKRSSCMYICQDCLVHLGDIARYRQQIDQAQSYYRHAAHLVPYNGQPYNQLAILEAAKGNKLSTVFFHIRSIAVKHPFPVAMTNLEKFYAKISKDIHDYRAKLTANELIGIFLQLHAFVFLCIDVTKAKAHADRLLANLPTHITSNTFSAHQLVQMVAVNLFSLYHSKRKHYSSGSGHQGMRNGGDKNGNSEGSVESRKPKEKGGGNQRTSFDLLFEITLSMFEVLLQSTPKDESKARDCHTLAPIKVLLDWLHTDPDSMSNPAFKTSSVWMNLSELLNNLQFFINQSEFMNDLQKHMSTPLPEDCDLECFLPVSKAHSDLTYYSSSSETLTEEMEMRLRCHRLVMSGFWIAEKFPSLNLLNVQQLANGHLEFSTQIKPMQGSNGDHKATRQNVAIQAIMQKGNKEVVDKKRDNAMNQSSRTGSCSRTTATEAKDIPEKLDAGVMAHALIGVGDGELSEKSFGSWSSMERLTNNSHSTAAGSPGSSHSVSTETSYAREFQPGSMPSIGAAQQPPYPYYLTQQQQGTSPMFVRPPASEAQMMPPIPSSTALVQQQQQGGIIGQRMMSPEQNGIGFPGPGKDPQPGHFDQLAALYSPGIRGFGPREPLVPPQGQAFFRIGQPPYSYGAMPPPPRNMMPMYMARQEDPASRGMPLPMGMMPLQWSRQPVVPPRMPFVPYPSLNEPPPKLSQNLPCDEFSYSQTSPPDPGVLDGMSHQSMQSANPDGFLFAPGVGTARFPTARSHLQSVLMNGADHVPGIPFSGLSYGEIEAGLDHPHGTRPRFMAQQGPRMYMGNGVHMSDVPSQPLGMFHNEKRILDELEMMQQNPDMKSNPDKVLSYPTSSGIAMNSFSCRAGDILKAESPQPIGARSQSSIFMTAANAKKEQLPASNTYTLFSQTPWTVGIAKSTDGNSHASSTFGSSNSSLRTTPDPDERSSVSSGGGYRGVGLFNRPMTAASNDGPWNTPSLANNSAPAAGSGALLNNSLQLQSLWNSGLSPLEKLLEQQRQQRQCEPR